MLSIKDYAEKSGVSYEAIRKQVNRYKDELGAWVYKQGRTQYLTEEAVAFLDQRRKENPIVVVEKEKNDRLQELEEQNEALKAKILYLQEQLISRDEKVIELQEQMLLLTTKPADLEKDLNPVEKETEKKKWFQFWK